MRNTILSLLFLLCFASNVFGVEFLPKYKDNFKNYGIGLYFGDGVATVYEKPNDTSTIIAKLTWNTDKVYINERVTEPKNVFAVFLPTNALSGFIAIDENDEKYTKIIYDNSKQLTGWVKNSPDVKAYYWRQLFYKYGRTKGLYLFADTPKSDKVLKLAPEDDAEISYEFIYPKHIRLQLIKGNWALLKVVDYDNEQKVGWFKWRNPDGTLNMFPKFDG